MGWKKNQKENQLTHNKQNTKWGVALQRDHYRVSEGLFAKGGREVQSGAFKKGKREILLVQSDTRKTTANSIFTCIGYRLMSDWNMCDNTS